ncbi:hypothetical protein BJV77DRAFT_1071528 [Russula vinacea]|nr:hypothetical protein BJV77DRAFT_1071528 [Russula vinacea]
MSHQNATIQASSKLDMSSVAALSFLVWDVLITLDQEVDAIWSSVLFFFSGVAFSHLSLRRTNSSYSKWLFFFVRYFAVAMQISLLFVGTELSISFHYTESDCVKWYIYQEVGTQLLVAAVESILIVRVHALYDRNLSVTVPLVVLFVLENIAMIATFVTVIPGVRFDATCTVIRSPPSLLIFAYGHVLLISSAILILVFYSAAFVLFETVLFVLTLIKFLVALRGGWGRTPVVFLLVRDGTWAFILIFVTLCVNAGFYIGEGNTAISAIAFPWLLSIESFAGARVVLNLHAISSDPSTDDSGTTFDGALSSHIVFTTHSTEEGNRPHTPSVRWDWGGIQEYPHGERSRLGTSSRSGTGTISETYEMTLATGASGLGVGTPKHCKASTSATHRTNLSTCSGTCVEAGLLEEDVG